jgi:hypothetical protein
MTQLAQFHLEDGSIIFIEATENIDSPSIRSFNPSEEEKSVTKGGVDPNRMLQNFKLLETTIRAYTTYTLNAFKEMGAANIDKVSLEFGIKVGGEAGIPYITKGTAESNLKITVECSFPKT